MSQAYSPCSYNHRSLCCTGIRCFRSTRSTYAQPAAKRRTRPVSPSLATTPAYSSRTVYSWMHSVFMLWHEQGINSALSHSFSSASASEEKMSLRSRSIRKRPCASLPCQLMGSWWSGHLVLLTGPCCSHFLAGYYRKSISILFLLKAPCGSLQEGSAPC